jgi:hypothetical protein
MLRRVSGDREKVVKLRLAGAVSMAGHYGRRVTIAATHGWRGL